MYKHKMSDQANTKRNGIPLREGWKWGKEGTNGLSIVNTNMGHSSATRSGITLNVAELIVC